MIDIVIEFLASILLWLMFFGAFILWIIDGAKKKEAALHALMASIVTWLFSLMIKNLFPTVRPFMVSGAEAMTLFVPKDGSFPSQHTAVAFALAVTIWMHNKKIGIVFLLFAFLVGLGRVLAHVHYPLDIVGGLVLGTVTAFMVEKIHIKG